MGLAGETAGWELVSHSRPAAGRIEVGHIGLVVADVVVVVDRTGTGPAPAAGIDHAGSRRAEVGRSLAAVDRIEVPVNHSLAAVDRTGAVDRIAGLGRSRRRTGVEEVGNRPERESRSPGVRRTGCMGLTLLKKVCVR